MKIYLAIPNEGWIRSELAIKLIRWIHEFQSIAEVVYESSVLRPIDHNRNTIVKRFLESDCDVLLQIDSDIVPDKNPLTLIMLGEDIVSAPCWIYQGKKILNIYKIDPTDESLVPVEPTQTTHLAEIDATGTGCLLVSRRVLERIKAPFARQYDDDGFAVLGQDLAFSKKAKAAGFKIFADMSMRCKHYKTVDIGEM